MSPRPATATLDQVAEELQISMRTAYRRVKDGSIPAFKMGTLWRCPASYLDKIRGEAESCHTLTAGDKSEQEEALSEGNTVEAEHVGGDLLVHPLHGHDAR